MSQVKIVHNIGSNTFPCGSPGIFSPISDSRCYCLYKKFSHLSRIVPIYKMVRATEFFNQKISPHVEVFINILFYGRKHRVAIQFIFQIVSNCFNYLMALLRCTVITPTSKLIRQYINSFQASEAIFFKKRCSK